MRGALAGAFGLAVVGLAGVALAQRPRDGRAVVREEGGRQ